MQKKINTTYFKKDLNLKTLPLNLKNMEQIIDNIAKRYPTLSKIDISIITKAFLEELREAVLNGKDVCIFDFVSHMRLYTYCKINNYNKLGFLAKIQVNTSPSMKAHYVKN